MCLDDFSQELCSHQICPAAPFLQWLLPLWTLGSTKVMAGFSFDAYTLIDRAQGVSLHSESWWFTALGAVQVAACDLDMTGGSPFSNGVNGDLVTQLGLHMGSVVRVFEVWTCQGIKTSAAFVECRAGTKRHGKYEK